MMTPKSAVLSLCLGLSAFAAAGSAYAGPAVSTRWRDSEMSQDECFHYADIAIQAAGFSRIERTTQSRYGTRDDYTAAIRCIIDHKIIFFIVAGPSLEQAPKYLDDIYDHF
jgi:hypothetical protein